MQTAATIVAPATPTGVSALAVVRVSGPAVAVVLLDVLQKDITKVAPRAMLRAIAKDPRTSDRLDDLLFSYFPGPKSYTGEDVLELFPHGNPLLVRQLVDAIRSVAGVRMAEPGEFTRRAFEAGKMDLVQAEAIGQLLHATVDSGIRNAQRLLEGRLSLQIRSLATSVKEISALLELEVDFAEEEADADSAKWLSRLQDIEKQLHSLKQNFRSAAAENKTPSVVFYGAPNAGKSSLVNALLQDDRLLVSPHAGTTRDVVEVLLLLDRGEIRLLDTAGISSIAVDDLDAAAQRKSHQRIAQADLAIFLVDCSQMENPEVKEQMDQATASGHWVLGTKLDICAQQSKINSPKVSSLTGDGIPEFLAMIQDHLFPQNSEQEEYWVSSERQLASLELALLGIRRALAHIETNRHAPEELAFELLSVRNHLSEITGQISTDEILDVVFQNFCIGK